jgi:hypothetical protein
VWGPLVLDLLCNQCLSPLMLSVRISIRARSTTLCDKACQWLTSRWVSSTNKNWYLEPLSTIFWLYRGGQFYMKTEKNHRPVAIHWQTLSHNVVYIYPIELEIKDITDTDRSASYFDLHLEIDSEGRLRTKLYDKKRWFQFSLCELSIDKHLHMEYISLSWYDIPELVVAIRISLIEGCC